MSDFYLGGVGGGVGSDVAVVVLLALFPLLDDATTAAAVGCDVLLFDVLVAITAALVALATVVVAVDWVDCCTFG